MLAVQKDRNKGIFFLIIMISVSLIFISTGYSLARIEWKLLDDIGLNETPKDIVLSNDNSIAYILCDKDILVFSLEDKKITDKIPTDGRFSSIAISKDDEMLFLTDAQSKKLSTIGLEMIYDIKAGDSPVIGNPEATVSVVAFLDFQCPHCARAFPLVEELLAKYPKSVNLIIKHYPLRSHRYAKSASLAALAASKQGKYKEFTGKLFEKFNQLNDGVVKGFAEELGLNTDEFNREWNDPSLNNIISQDIRDGSYARVRGVPTLFINGRRVKVRTIEAMSEMVDSELKKNK